MQGIWRNAAVVIALVLAVAFGADRLSHSDRIEPRPAPQATGEQIHVVWSHGRDGSVRNAEEHWEKHGTEFPEFHSAREYEEGALRFVTDPPPGTLTKANDRGDTLYYDPATNTFAVKDRRGEPRTFFRPDDGRAYWDRQ
jgi:pyocin large subunit-like protein